METIITLNEIVASRVRAVIGAQSIQMPAVANAWHQSIDMASRRVNGKVELKLKEIEAFAELTGYQPLDFFGPHFDIRIASPILANAA